VVDYVLWRSTCSATAALCCLLCIACSFDPTAKSGEARCGNGVFEPERAEQCDDGNDDNGDACSAGCIAATCSDGARNGDETDVDCGGPACGPCPVGAACAAAADCVSADCVDATCAHYQSCAAARAASPELASGILSIDVDGGAGPIASADVYCDMDTAGGGWQLISAVSAESRQVIIGEGYCTSPDAELGCKGQIHPAQVSATSSILVRDETRGHWVRYGQFAADANSALRYFSRELIVANSSDCEEADNVCSTANRDPDLIVLETSGFVLAVSAPLYQWWRYGGWWVGAAPQAGSIEGRLHATSYSSVQDIRQRSTPDSASEEVAAGDQTLWYREY
jgi:cysteine-rich repeat protein